MAELENLCSEAKSTLEACVKEAKAVGGSISEGVHQDMSAAVEEVGCLDVAAWFREFVFPWAPCPLQAL